VGRPPGVPSTSWHRYTADQGAYLREIIPGHPHREIARMVNERFDLGLTVRQIASFCKNNGISTGLTGRFPKGHEPANKGTRGMHHGSNTSFRGGNVPANRVPIGTERLREDGYLYVKVADGRKNANWRQKHIVIWEEANGPLPPDHVLIFANRDSQDVRLENLVLAERADLAPLNKLGLIGWDSDSTRAGVLTAKLIRKASTRAAHVGASTKAEGTAS
jgi:hypothetical protein